MIEKIPDITAYRLDEAINILEKKGIKFKLNNTISPISGLATHGEKEVFPKNCRVVKQVKLKDHVIELTIVVVE